MEGQGGLLNGSHIPVEQDGLGAYQYHDSVRRILHMLEIEGVLCALVDWTKRMDGFQPKASFVLVEAELRLKDPQLLLEYLLSLEWEVEEEDDGGSHCSTEEDRSLARGRTRDTKMPVIEQVIEQYEMSVVRNSRKWQMPISTSKKTSQKYFMSQRNSQSMDASRQLPRGRTKVLNYLIYSTQKKGGKQIERHEIPHDFIINYEAD